MNMAEKKKKKKKHNEDEEVYYQVTPKGLAWLAFQEAHIRINLEQLDEFWNSFEKHMRRTGYTE